MSRQLDLLDDLQSPRRSRQEILASVQKLMEYHKQGLLGGHRMPEDANPGLDRYSRDNYHYFTLPMALNYQRNSYKLWETALATYEDRTTRQVFHPEQVAGLSETDLCAALTKHRLALQPHRHTSIWRTICETLVQYYQADVRVLFTSNDDDVALILKELQQVRKTGFPYLSGQKIANYWLYVICQYTDAQLQNRPLLSVAPDTHVIQASIVLGVVQDIGDQNRLRPLVADAWREILSGTDLCPIDIHTPLWLWSKNRFRPGV